LSGSGLESGVECDVVRLSGSGLESGVECDVVRFLFFSVEGVCDLAPSRGVKVTLLLPLELEELVKLALSFMFHSPVTLFQLTASLGGLPRGLAKGVPKRTNVKNACALLSVAIPMEMRYYSGRKTTTNGIE